MVCDLTFRNNSLWIYPGTDRRDTPMNDLFEALFCPVHGIVPKLAPALAVAGPYIKNFFCHCATTLRSVRYNKKGN